MAHKCNICKKEMIPVEDINVKGLFIKGFRCECGNEHSNAEDVDILVRYFRALKNKNIV